MKSWVGGFVLAAGLALALGESAAAQGCSQCREAVGQTPSATQRAYRHGIEVLVAAAVLVCGATVVVVRRFR